MLRINLIIADTDEFYAESLSKFISSKYQRSFNIYVFTDMQSLKDFLERGTIGIDIMLVCESMNLKEIIHMSNGICICLDEGRGSGSSEDRSIFKYQPGDRIVNELLKTYSETSSGKKNLSMPTGNAQVILVFSPVGGSGKTLISTGLAAYFSQIGRRVFLLNLETTNTMSLYFGSLSDSPGLSCVFLGLKQGSSNLAYKIQAAKSRDTKFNFDYFSKAECCMEHEEITAAEINTLLNELSTSGDYDIIVVDTDSNLNSKALALFDISNMIVLPLLREASADIKLESFIFNLERAGEAYHRLFFKKAIPVLNHRWPSGQGDAVVVNGEVVESILPYMKNIFINEGSKVIFNYFEEFHGNIKPIGINIMSNLNLYNQKVDAYDDR